MHGTTKTTRKFGDARDNEPTGRKSTMPARQRAGATYAGGKRLRKTMAKLAARQNNFNGKQGYTKPGSMKA